MNLPIFNVETTAISNSKLNKYRQMIDGIEPNYDFLSKYLHFGQLVDALITEPHMVDLGKRRLNCQTRYDSSIYEYNEEDFNIALIMRDAFMADPLARSIHGLSSKFIFNNEQFQFQYDDAIYQIPTDGELDLGSVNYKVGADCKMTTCPTKKEFFKKVHELHYDQQATFYMDNCGLDKFVIIGISRKSKKEGGFDPKTGLPKIFHYTIERGSSEYIKGAERYRYWSKRLIDHRVENNEAKMTKTKVNKPIFDFMVA